MNFCDTLKKFFDRSNLTESRVVKLSEVPRGTFRKWMEGTSKQVRQWHGLIRVADVLGCNAEETLELLTSAGLAVDDLNTLWADTPENLRPVISQILARESGTIHAPFQPPQNLPYFVGRERELGEVQRILLDARYRRCALTGMGGIGKTTLAIHLAHDLRDLFPDGVLWASLDNSHPMHILSSFAAAYDHTVSHAADLGSRSQAVRGLLADKQGLMILDNAERSTDLEPLLPATDSWAVLVTSRRRDLGIIQRQFTMMDIKSFEAKESLTLFARRVAEPTNRTDAPLFDAIAALLGHHPLSLDIIASHLSVGAVQDISGYLRQLQEEKARFDVLHNEEWNVRASLQISYDALSSEYQSLFAALSVFHGSFSLEAVGFITERPVSEVEAALHHLHQRSLIQPVSDLYTRYRLHPVLRVLAGGYLDDPMVKRRMVLYYRDYTREYQQDFERLDVEVENIEGALEEAPQVGMTQSYLQMARFYYPFLRVRGLYSAAEMYLEKAVSIAREQDDRPALMDVLYSLGELYEAIISREKAASILHEGLTLATRYGDESRRSTFLLALGTLEGRRNQFEQAEIYFQEGASTARRSSNLLVLGQLLQRLSSCTIQTEQYEAADRYLEEGFAIADQINDDDTLTQLLTNRGELANRRGQDRQARADWEAALVLARENQHNERICNLVSNLASLEIRLGRHEQARPYLQEASRLVESLGHPWHRISLKIYWGDWYMAMERTDEAETAFNQAATLNEGEFHDLQAEILYGLARVAEVRGNLQQAQRLASDSQALSESISYHLPTLEAFQKRLERRRSNR